MSLNRGIKNSHDTHDDKAEDGNNKKTKLSSPETSLLKREEMTKPRVIITLSGSSPVVPSSSSGNTSKLSKPIEEKILPQELVPTQANVRTVPYANKIGTHFRKLLEKENASDKSIDAFQTTLCAIREASKNPCTHDDIRMMRLLTGITAGFTLQSYARPALNKRSILYFAFRIQNWKLIDICLSAFKSRDLMTRYIVKQVIESDLPQGPLEHFLKFNKPSISNELEHYLYHFYNADTQNTPEAYYEKIAIFLSALEPEAKKEDIEIVINAIQFRFLHGNHAKLLEFNRSNRTIEKLSFITIINSIADIRPPEWHYARSERTSLDYTPYTTRRTPTYEEFIFMLNSFSNPAEQLVILTNFADLKLFNLAVSNRDKCDYKNKSLRIELDRKLQENDTYRNLYQEALADAQLKLDYREAQLEEYNKISVAHFNGYKTDLFYINYFKISKTGMTDSEKIQLRSNLKNKFASYFNTLKPNDHSTAHNIRLIALAQDHPHFKAAQEAEPDDILFALPSNVLTWLNQGADKILKSLVLHLQRPTLEIRRNAVRRSQGRELQSTHARSVHRTVSESATRLQARYHTKVNDDTELEKILDEAESYFLQNYHEAKEDTDIEKKNSLIVDGYVSSRYVHGKYIDPASGIDNRHALAYVWLGTEDKALNMDTPSERRLIAKALYEIETEYKEVNESACQSGIFNQLIGATSHPDVKITQVSIASIADFMKDFAEAYYLSWPSLKQRALVQEQFLTEDSQKILSEEIMQYMKTAFLPTMQTHIDNKDIPKTSLDSYLDEFVIEMIRHVTLEMELIEFYQEALNALSALEQEIVLGKNTEASAAFINEKKEPFIQSLANKGFDFPKDILDLRFQKPVYIADFPRLIKKPHPHQGFLFSPSSSSSATRANNAIEDHSQANMAGVQNHATK